MDEGPGWHETGCDVPWWLIVAVGALMAALPVLVVSLILSLA